MFIGKYPLLPSAKQHECLYTMFTIEFCIFQIIYQRMENIPLSQLSRVNLKTNQGKWLLLKHGVLEFELLFKNSLLNSRMQSITSISFVGTYQLFICNLIEYQF